MSKIARIGLSSVFFLLVSCNSPSGDKIPQTGHYEGNEIRSKRGVLEKKVVSAELVRPSGDDSVLRIDLAGLDQSPISSYQLKFGASSIDVTAPDTEIGNVSLVPDGDCYTTQDPLVVKVCTTSSEVKVEASQKSGAPVYSLTLDFFPAHDQVILEEPQVYSVKDAVKKAFSMSFGSRIEFERSSQARLQSKNAYLNLLPHLSTGSIVALAEHNPYGMVAAIGDLAPFLLPSRWLHAKQRQRMSEAESFALTVMRGDIGVQVEAQSLAILRDEEILREYETTIRDFKKLKDEIERRARLGDFPVSAPDSMETSINGLESDSAALDLNREEQDSFISQSLGLMNPKAVSAIQFDGEDLAVEDASPLSDEDTLERTALDRSFEVRQMDSIEAAARDANYAAAFEWLDPSGDPSAGLGFGLPSAVGIKNSDVEQLKIVRQQVQASVLQKTSIAIGQYNDSLKDFAHATKNLKLQERRVQRVLNQLKVSNDVTLLDLVNVYQDRLKARVGVESSRAVFRIARAKLDRLLLRGLYSQLSSLPDPQGF